jgi:hypothetical protein
MILFLSYNISYHISITLSSIVYAHTKINLKHILTKRPQYGAAKLKTEQIANIVFVK